VFYTTQIFDFFSTSIKIFPPKVNARMAPALVESLREPSTLLDHRPSKALFPDGIKTSGQQNPNYDQIQPYSAFPKEIVGETVWKAEDYVDRPEQWVHRFNEREIGELSEAADAFLASGTPLTGIMQVSTLIVGLIHLSDNPASIGEVSTAYHATLLDLNAKRTFEWQGLHIVQGISS
jgi:hypothetical protein